MLKEQIIQRLRQIDQLHLAKGLDCLSDANQKKLLKTLLTDLLQKQKQLLSQPRTATHKIMPVFDADKACDRWLAPGNKRLSQGKVACLILAGGQGSRLQTSTPKALIAVTPDQQKTLLELQLEKIAKASTASQIPCAILTSAANYLQIDQFLKKRHFCGLSPKLLELVIQTEAPFVDDQGNWILKDSGELATGPDGNGHALHLLESVGILKEWEKQGIEEITITPIDNALANPVDPILLGYHASCLSDVTLKVIQRKNPNESMGIIVYKEGKIAVHEYSELDPSQNPQNCLANIGIFVLNLSFAKKICQIEFPWHIARKRDPNTQAWIWKFERFIFDMLPYSENTRLLLYPREEVYAPLKNASGDQSLLTVQEALKKLENGFN